MHLHLEWLQTVRSTGTAGLTGKTISTRIIRKTIRFPSYICRSVTMDIWRSQQKTAKKPFGYTRCIWKRMPES